jgi:hypothetical protein
LTDNRHANTQTLNTKTARNNSQARPVLSFFRATDAPTKNKGNRIGYPLNKGVTLKYSGMGKYSIAPNISHLGRFFINPINDIRSDIGQHQNNTNSTIVNGGFIFAFLSSCLSPA